MVEKWTLYIGLNDKDTKRQELDTITIYKIINSEVAKWFDGATISEAHGVYKHDDGTVVIEKSLRVEILFAEREHVKNFVGWVKDTLNQESVAVQHEVVDSELW